MSKYTAEQYKTLADRFNKMTFLHKLITIKNTPQLFYLDTDGYNVELRLVDDEAMFNGFDDLFEFPTTFEFHHLKDVFSLIDIKVKEL